MTAPGDRADEVAPPDRAHQIAQELWSDNSLGRTEWFVKAIAAALRAHTLRTISDGVAAAERARADAAEKRAERLAGAARAAYHAVYMGRENGELGRLRDALEAYDTRPAMSEEEVPS